MYYYNATVDRVVDGDTLDLTVDVGFRIYVQQRFRLYLYNAPETRGDERDLGLLAKKHLLDILPQGLQVNVKTYKADSFGRYLSSVYTEKQGDLVNYLVSNGWGVYWDGRGLRPSFDPKSLYPNIPA